MLAQFAWVYEGMSALGWAHSEVDEMEVWEVARYLGIGSDGPIAAGSRGITLPSDRAKGSTAAGHSDSRVAARAAEHEARQRKNREA